jgi:hypothetical protein
VAARNAQQILNEAEAAACRLAESALGVLGDGLGRVGRLGGTVNVAPSISVSIKSIQVVELFKSLVIETDVQARTPIKASLSFVPSNVTGHLVCLFPFAGKEVRANGSLGPREVKLSGVITTNDKNEIQLVTDKVEKMKFTVQPPPARALFLQNPDLTIRCTGLATLAGLGEVFQALQASDLPSAITGEFEEALPSQTIPVELGNIKIPLPTREISLKGMIGETAFVYR